MTVGEPLIIVRSLSTSDSPGPSADKLIYEGIDTSYGPLFSVGEVSRIFLKQQGPWWLRRREEKVMVNGQPWTAQRTGSNARTYELSDVELLLHGMAEAKFISTEMMSDGLMVLLWLGYLHGYLTREA